MTSTRLPRSALAAALALALTALPFAASADVAAADAPGDIRTRQATPLEKVEVVGEKSEGYSVKRSSTATRTDTPLLDTPQAITVVSNELIKDQAMQGMADIVRYVPGVGMAQGEGNRDTPVFRGNSSTADLFIDGMRDDVQYFRDLYNIDRVEALKGPNAMAFGRGGSGGLLNRVTKQPNWRLTRGLALQAGSWDRRRATLDVGQPLNERVALRATALFEDSGSFRDGVGVDRRGINPTAAWRNESGTAVTAGVEHFEESRTADRGVPSVNGRPIDVDPDTFFGDAERSTARVDVDALNLLIEHDFENGLSLRNRSRRADYDKFYQNIYPGSVLSSGLVSLSAYNNATQRQNLLNQTDLTYVASAGRVTHTLLAGVELSRQETDNYRETGFFPANACPSMTSSATCVPAGDPRYAGPVEFRQSASDADNHGVSRGAALYIQDQVELTSHWQAILGLRHDRLETELLNRRTGVSLSSTDNLLSPRVGLIYKPWDQVSIYGNYSIAFLPRSGEQLASLSVNNAALDPERFRNLEVGAKWELARGLSATAALYRLDRTNVAVVDPSDPARLILLAGNSQRVRGLELGISGELTDDWKVMGGYAYQDGETLQDIRTSATGAVLPAGTILAQVPRHTFSLWNRYDATPRWAFGLGVVARSSMFASTSNAVTLPGFARLDGAVFFRIDDRARLQLNVENLFDKRYIASAHSDNNISPGSPRAFNLGLNLEF